MSVSLGRFGGVTLRYSLVRSGSQGGVGIAVASSSLEPGQILVGQKDQTQHVLPRCFSSSSGSSLSACARDWGKPYWAHYHGLHSQRRKGKGTSHSLDLDLGLGLGLGLGFGGFSVSQQPLRRSGTYLSRRWRRKAKVGQARGVEYDQSNSEEVEEEVEEETSTRSTKMAVEDDYEEVNQRSSSERAKKKRPDEVVEEKEREKQKEETKGLRVGLIGAPNAGKSMLTNCLLGRKITAVSNKVNTTTSQTFGVLTSKNIQLTVFDTPGVVDHLHYKDMKQRERVSDAYATAALCDALVFVVDAERQMRRPDPRVERLLLEYKEELKNFDGEQQQQTPTSILALSKVDLIDMEQKGNLLEMAKQLSDLGSFDKIFMISSLKGLGTGDLVDYLKSVSQTRKWNMNENDSSHNHETLAMELVKEQVYRRLNGEIPYELKIVPVSCKFLRDGSLRIEQDLLVNHMKKKKIVVGKRGQAIGQIGCRARVELEKSLNLKVHLILNVKVRKQ